MSDFGVADIEIGQREMSERLPFLAVFTGEDADGAVRGDMGAAFAEDAEPLVFVADEVREGIVRSGIPDPGAFDREEGKGGE